LYDRRDRPAAVEKIAAKQPDLVSRLLKASPLS
jgi:hypothetical protein